MPTPKTEPVLFAGLFRAAVLAALYFGVQLSVEDLAVAYGAIEVIVSAIARSRVTPVA
jgi:hypothetical protein